MGDEKKDPKLEKVSKAVNRRKTALQKLKKGEKPGTVSERKLKKLLKQAQRRKKKVAAQVAKHQKKSAPAAEASA